MSIAEVGVQADESGMFMMVRDPCCVFVYWEMGETLQTLIASHFGLQTSAWTLHLRLHDVTEMYFDGANTKCSRDVEVNALRAGWYFQHLQPGHCYIADLCLASSNRSLFALLRSNVVAVPQVSLRTGPVQFARLFDVTPCESLASAAPASDDGLPYQGIFDGYSIVE